MKSHAKKPWGSASIVISGVVALGSGALTLYFLRQNNLTMLEKRQAVLDADAAQQDVRPKLAELQSFVTTHMNTSLPKLGTAPAIQLKTTYDKLIAAEQQRVSTERQRISEEATTYCEANVRGLLSNRAACVADYTAARQVTEQSISSDLYKYNFASPRWSPDAAGFFMLAAMVAIFVLFLQLAARLIARILLPE